MREREQRQDRCLGRRQRKDNGRRCTNCCGDSGAAAELARDQESGLQALGVEGQREGHLAAGRRAQARRGSNVLLWYARLKFESETLLIFYDNRFYSASRVLIDINGHF